MALETDAFERAWRDHQAGDFRAAEDAYRRILRHEPRRARVWFALGLVCQTERRLSEAVAYFRQALDIEPQEGEGYFHLGNALLQQEDWAAAGDAYRRCLESLPGHVESLVNLGFVLGEQQRHAEAENCYRQALAQQPDLAEIHQNLGNTLREQGRLDEAVDRYHEALRLRPNYAKAHVNLGVALVSLGQIGSSIEHLQRGVEIDPEFAEAHNSLGAAVSVERRFDEALACYQRAIDLKPDYADAHWNRSLVWLLRGDFARGWPAYEWRWRCPRTVQLPKFEQPRWDGSPLAGRTLLLHAEQGLGDTLHFIRYATLARARGGRVVVVCQPQLLPILRSCSGIDELIAQGEPLPPFDVYAELLSLPGLIGTSSATIPSGVPYLSAGDELVTHWRRELAAVRGFRVGIAWQGSARHPWDRHRSAALEHFAPLARVPGVRLVSLQKGAASEQARGAAIAVRNISGEPFEVISPGTQVDETSGPFMDTAAIIRNLDLVVAVDTAVAHLAGALAAPVWLALNYSPDWRWLLDREDSPWYPTMRLFRQTALGDWASVFDRMAYELAALVAGRPPRPVLLRATGGELIDRWAALQVELEQPICPDRAHALWSDLAELDAARRDAGLIGGDFDDLAAKLRELHRRRRPLEDAWQTATELTPLGRDELAASLWRIDDERRRLLRTLNEL